MDIGNGRNIETDIGVGFRGNYVEGMGNIFGRVNDMDLVKAIVMGCICY